jgi:hypothetical protein
MKGANPMATWLLTAAWGLMLALLWTLVASLAVTLIARRAQWPTRAPGLDVWVGLLIWIPWVVWAWQGGWAGLFGCLLGQYAGLQVFCILHTNASGHRGGQIRRTLDRIVGPPANHAGLLATVPALPIFLGIRVGEVLFYPLLVWILRFPRINHAEWINVSRQKVDGLVGHDLVWCLYCDWMTGVYSLGAEMLRSVESFWCPIKFYDGKKCENCRIDFPDIDAWANPEKDTMDDVADLLLQQYPIGSEEERGWWKGKRRE